jgi:hypothetical protein
MYSSRGSGLITLTNSKNEPCIQAADFIAGALHYYYRTDDDTFSGIIDEKVALAFDYFKGPQK